MEAPEGGGRFVSVGCGGLFTVAVTEQGEVFAFGDGMFGQLGKLEASVLDRTESSPVRVGVLPPPGVLRGGGSPPLVACGSAHVLAW